MLKEPFTARIKEKPKNTTKEEPTLCLSTGKGRYFFIHRLSQIRKRNPNKEIRKRIKEIDSLMLYSS